jgi:tRNA(Ile)-lysidine synthase
MTSNITARVSRFIKVKHLFKPKETVVVAVSGGGDSVALLHILHQLSREGLGLQLHVAHLNHMIRGEEADADERFVRGLAPRLGLPASIQRRDVPGIRETVKGSLEEAARTIRYEFLGEVAGKVGARKIATGHTASDQAETMLQRVARGTGLRGLAGIPVRRKLGPSSRIEVVRPLLGCWRQELRGFLGEKRRRWREDSSNQDTRILRNRLRLKVLPLLKRHLDPEIETRLVALANSAAEVESYFVGQARRLLRSQRMKGKASGVELSARWLTSQPELMQRYILREVIESVSGSLTSEKHITAAMELAGRQPPSRLAQLPGNVEMTKEYDRLIFQPPAGDAGKSQAQWESELAVPGRAELPDQEFVIEAELVGKKELDLGRWKVHKGGFEEILDADKLRGRLRVRCRREGDRFWPLGAPGAKKLKQFFIDARVPVRLRASVPLVTDDEKIIWVAGYRLSNQVAVDDGSKRLLHVAHKRLPPVGTRK